MTTDATALTYLFTDLEGSTRLWERHPGAMRAALARHDAILRDAVERAGGTVVKTTGDGLMAVFDTALAAVDASLGAQRSLRDEPWSDTGPLKVRMGLHVGDSQARAGDYYGTAVNRAARVMSAAHGGQVLLSAPIAAMVRGGLPPDVSLRDLGTHRLKDLAAPEQLFQLVEPGLAQAFPALATLDLRPNNLPTQTSAFLGREAVLAELRTMLDADESRLVTLTGPGGTGKTRLALQTAAEQVDRFDDGVFFVDVSAEREPDAAFAAVMRAVSVGATGEDPPLEVLKRGLRDASMLLLLDNFEQVTAAAAGLVDLLEHCPHLQVLVTSREALRVRGERLFPVPPLHLPSARDDGSVSVEDALDAEAVQLFQDRAAAIRPDFAITDANVAAVVAICARLDGLPLAIELAAARVNLFAVDELRVRLDERMDVLRSGARDLPERQRTLRSAIEWSDELLSDEERRLMQLFSVFVGARLRDVEDTAQRIADLRELDTVELLSSLVDKSLVRSMQDSAGRPRFSMLQTIRAYAREQLDRRPDDAAVVQRAHAEHYTELATGLRERLADTDREDVLAAVSVELGNFRAAWAHWVASGDVVRLNELLELLWGYHDALGEYGAAVDLGNDLLGVLKIQPETAERIRDEIAIEMSLARSLIAVRGYTAEVEQSIRDVLARSDAAGDAQQQFPVLRSLAALYMMRADFRSGVEVGRELLAIAERQGDESLLADAHLVVGTNTAFSEDLAAGVRHLDRSIEHFEASKPGLVRFRVGPAPGVISNVVSGLLLWVLGFPDRAVARVDRALELTVELGHPYSRAYGLYHAAVLDLWRHDLELVADRADQLLRVANAHDYPIWRALALVLRGTAQIGSGDVEPGLAEVERGFTLYRGISTPPVFWPALLQVRATGCAMAGRLSDAVVFVEEAEAIVSAEDFQMADLLLGHGDLLLALPSPDPDLAESLFERALAIARGCGARMSHLQAATRLAMIRRGTPREDEALAALREVYDTFTEGLGTPQVEAAREALGID